MNYLLFPKSYLQFKSKTRNYKIHSNVCLEGFCFVMKISSFRSTCRYDEEAQALNLFNEYFSNIKFFFKSILSRKNWRGGDEVLLKNGTLDGYAYKLCCFSGRIYVAPDEGPLTL